MDFGDILTKWEKKNSGNKTLDDGFNKDLFLPPKKNLAAERRSRLLHKLPDASIDLHGLKRDEAWTSLQTFFENSRNSGLEKVLIIHGKGSHSGTAANDGVLRDIVRQFIESCSWAGESGFSSSREGGRGATWVILKGQSAD